jgi:hypothetical protein
VLTFIRGLAEAIRRVLSVICIDEKKEPVLDCDVSGYVRSSMSIIAIVLGRRVKLSSIWQTVVCYH